MCSVCQLWIDGFVKHESASSLSTVTFRPASYALEDLVHSSQGVEDTAISQETECARVRACVFVCACVHALCVSVYLNG